MRSHEVVVDSVTGNDRGIRNLMTSHNFLSIFNFHSSPQFLLFRISPFRGDVSLRLLRLTVVVFWQFQYPVWCRAEISRNAEGKLGDPVLNRTGRHLFS